MSTQTVSPGEQPRQCITDSDARGFAAGKLRPERMHEIDGHCYQCVKCAALVADFVLGRPR